MTVGIIVGTIAIVLITVVVGSIVDRKHALLPKPDELREERRSPPIGHAAGDAPATAIRARESAIVKLRAQRCRTCRSELTNDADDTVRYDERELLVLHFTCARCGAKRSLYVDRASLAVRGIG